MSLNDSLNDLPAFLAVAERRSFRKAAEALGMTSAGVSKAVSRLESTVGARLFTRTTRRVDLTPEGIAFLSRAQAAMDSLADGMATLDMMREASSGTVRLSCSVVLADLIAATLPELSVRYPGLDLHLSVSDTPVDLSREGVDIALRVGGDAPGHLRQRRLARLRWKTVAAPAYLAIHGSPADPGDLGRHRCLVFSRPDGVGVPWRFHTSDGEVEVRPAPAFSVDQGMVSVTAALAGHGIAQVFDHMVRDHVHSGRLVPVLTAFDAQGPELSALFLPGQAARQRIRVTLDHLYATFRRFG